MKKHLLIFDGNNILNRGYHAVPFMSSPKGIPTNAVKGAMNIMMSAVSRFSPTHVAVVFDHPSKNFRHDLFPEYKGNRERDPEKHARLKPQKKLIRKMLKRLGIKVFHKKGLEADDVIGTLAVSADGFDQITIVSNDKDFAQLLTRRIRMLRVTGSGDNRVEHTLTSKNCEEHFGVKPNQIVDFLMILGDKVDNIPGVKGMGEKRAADFLKQHGSIIDAIDLGNAPAAIAQSKKQFKLTRKLVTIKTDLFEPDYKKLKLRKQNTDEFISLCKKHHMAALQSSVLKVMLNATTT